MAIQRSDTNWARLISDNERIVKVAIRMKARSYGFQVNEEEVKDISQEVWKRVWINKDTINKLDSWVFVVSGNATMDYLKHNRIKKVDLENEATELELRVPESHIHNEIAVADMKGVIRKHLTGKTRKIMELVIEGYTYKEVSNHLSLPMGIISSYISRAREVVWAL